MTATGVADQGTPSPVGTPFDCPISRPNGNDPPPADIGGEGGYGNEALWTTLTMWGPDPGIVPAPNDGHLRPDGSVIEMKWAWYRYIPGKLTIEGRRLDAPAPPLKAWVPDGYGDQGFQVGGITFPSNGCWEITGRVGGGSLTFVVLVIWPDGFTPAATPIPWTTPTSSVIPVPV
jgi:hypothetical protein